MKRATKEYRRTRIVVSGKGHFPTRLLQEENCIPDSGQDVILIEAYSTLARQVSLSRFTLDGAKTDPLVWKTLGWTVIFDDGS